MKTNRDRAFEPRLESLEDRALLSAAAFLFRPRLVPLPPRGTVLSIGGTGTPGAVRTIVNPGNAASFTVSIVPRDSSPLNSTFRGTTTVHGLDAGLAGPGLPTPNALAHDPGLTTPGLPNLHPSVPVQQ